MHFFKCFHQKMKYAHGLDNQNVLLHAYIYVNTSLSTFLLLLAYVTHIVAYLCTHTVLRASHNKGKVCQPPLVLLWATPTTLWPNILPQYVCTTKTHACNQSYMRTVAFIVNSY